MEKDWTKEDYMLLCDSEVIVGWGDAPEAFRFVIDKKKLAKLARVASVITLYVIDMPIPVVPQKGSLLTSLSSAYDDDLFAATFNGIDLHIIGKLDTSFGGGNE